MNNPNEASNKHGSDLDANSTLNGDKEYADRDQRLKDIQDKLLEKA